LILANLDDAFANNRISTPRPMKMQIESGVIYSRQLPGNVPVGDFPAQLLVLES
jgi:hypothetical protein